jgi:hypothetical protein
MSQKFRDVNEKGEVTYQWHPGQLQTLASQKRFTAMIAGTQGGKTCLGPEWLYRMIMGYKDKKTRKTVKGCGTGDYLAVEATYDLFKLKMLPEMLWYFVEAKKIGRYWAADRVIEIAEECKSGKFLAKNAADPMWARIILRSAEAKAGLESATAKAAWLDEAGMPDFSRTAWEAVQRRLSISQGKVLFTTTLYDWGWFKSEIYDRWEKGDPDYAVIQFDSILNPAFPKEEYERARMTLPQWKFDLFYRGRYSRPAGLVYDAFDEKQCKVHRFPIPVEWPVYVGHDFGPVHTAALWYAMNPENGCLYLFREYITAEKKTAVQHAAEFLRLSRGENIIKRLGGSHTEAGWREAYQLAGWPIGEPAIRDVEIGIDRVYGWHKTGKLFVFDDMFDYLAEKLSYSRTLDASYNPTDEIKDKSRFHLMDAERYIISDFLPADLVRPRVKPKARSYI